MRVFRLSEGQRQEFAHAGEARMGIHVSFDGPFPALVVANQVLMSINDEFDAQGIRHRSAYDAFGMYNEHHMSFRAKGSIIRDRSPTENFQYWLDSLPEAPKGVHATVEDSDRYFVEAAMAFMVTGSTWPLPNPPTRPSYVYGHLPFLGVCTEGDVFYRFESSPNSWRVNQETGIIAGSTYGCPPSELPLIPSGLAVVARYALPSVLPARWRYEIRPAPGTPFRFGASVPLYGQSGGGVEVMFPHAFQNVGPIANPVVIPEL